jgi:Na+-driven multidrug efflux pump
MTRLAVPIASSILMQQIGQQVAVMFVGQLGPAQLVSAFAVPSAVPISHPTVAFSLRALTGPDLPQFRQGASVLANMWANVSGLSICSGGMTGMDSLAAQAFGASEYELVGVLLQRCLFIVTCLCLPVFFLWFFVTEPFLVILGADAETVELAVFYCKVYYFYLWPTLVQRALTSFLQCQGIVRPATAVVAVGTACGVPVVRLLCQSSLLCPQLF